MKGTVSLKREELIEYLALSLLVTLLAWSVGFNLFVRDARAASLTNVSDTISNSDLGANATHTITFTNASSMGATERLRITFDPLTNLFNNVSSTSFSNITFSGATLVAACGGGPDEVTFATTSMAAGDESGLFTVCATDTVSAGTKTITFGGPVITNPTGTLSYVIRIQHETSGGSILNNADTRVAIISNVDVTASVDTSFTFTIAGVATGTTINGVTTTLGSTSTALNFGTLPVGSPVTLGQQLTVSTNARNGFVVTVKEDQNLLSQTGADIDLFANGIADSTPMAWSSPSSTLNAENTYGHIGVTSNDADLNSGEFNGSLFAGNFQVTSSRAIFSSTGTSDGTTQNIGLASVAFRIQIGALQEAATDYRNILTYVATPTF